VYGGDVCEFVSWPGGTYAHTRSQCGIQILEGTPTITGYLEVSVNGVIVHSKKVCRLVSFANTLVLFNQNGDGYVNTDEKIKRIVNAVGEALKQA
jgi:hypothetical protein